MFIKVLNNVNIYLLRLKMTAMKNFITKEPDANEKCLLSHLPALKYMSPRQK